MLSLFNLDPGAYTLVQWSRFPAGRTTQRGPVSNLDIAAEWKELDGLTEILICARRFAWGVRVAADGFQPDDAYFGLEPGVARRVVLTPLRKPDYPVKTVVTAVNAEGRLRI